MRLSVFLRETRRTNRESYLQLAHNERHPVSGNPVAKVIHNFGRAEKVDRAALARLVSSISRFLTPEQAMGATPAAGTGEVEVLDSRRLGAAWTLDRIWERLGIGAAICRVTWATRGVIVVTSQSGTTSPGLGILLVVAAGALLVPTVAALVSKAMASLVLVAAAARFAISGGYELTSSPGWRYAAGVCGVVVAGLALYAALAAEVDSATRRSLLPLLRPAAGKRAVSGRLADHVATLGREPGVRQQL